MTYVAGCTSASTTSYTHAAACFKPWCSVEVELAPSQHPPPPLPDHMLQYHACNNISTSPIILTHLFWRCPSYKGCSDHDPFSVLCQTLGTHSNLPTRYQFPSFMQMPATLSMLAGAHCHDCMAGRSVPTTQKRICKVMSMRWHAEISCGPVSATCAQAKTHNAITPSNWRPPTSSARDAFTVTQTHSQPAAL